MNVAKTSAYVGIQSQSGMVGSSGRSIQTKIVHPSYNSNIYVNDIALLKVSEIDSTIGVLGGWEHCCTQLFNVVKKPSYRTQFNPVM